MPQTAPRGRSTWPTHPPIAESRLADCQFDAGDDPGERMHECDDVDAESAIADPPSVNGRDRRADPFTRWPLSLRPNWPSRLLPRGEHGLQALAIRTFPGPWQAVEPQCGRRLPHGAARLQRRPAWDDLERVGARNRSGERPCHLHAGCSPGSGQFSQAVLDRIPRQDEGIVDLLGRFHIYTLLDMHQDVYNELFDGEGAPNWAVCTSGASNTDPPGRWSQNYGTAAAGAAFRHFWTNDVVGDLQGEYDRVWAAVATYFKDDPWVLGYDPFNEPFSTSLVKSGDEKFDGQLECFYTGRSFVGAPTHGAPPISCPPGVPASGVIPAIQTADPGALVFYEPDIFSSRGSTNFVGPMPFANLVFNVHVYCGHRSGKTGNPTDIAACANQEQRSFTEARRRPDRPRHHGAAWRTSVVPERVRCHLEPDAARSPDGRSRPELGRLDLLVLAVLCGPDREFR